jgi:transposase
MDRCVERCAGLDVHKDSLAATVRVPGPRGERRQETRTFATTTRGLLALADWLASYDVTRVGMESTGCYWKPVWYVLEERFECWLLNARHLRHVPGRKTDVADSAWICELVEHGLVRPSLVPPRPIRELRDLTRYRKAQIEERAREVQRLDKVLQDAGIKLSSVAAKTLGVSVRLMLDALVAGTHDPEVLADLARGRLRSKLPALREALAGRFRGEHHGLLVGQILAHIDYLDETIASLSAEIEERLRPFERELGLLETIPGVGRITAEVMLAELGPDMSRFPSDRHAASWAAICPGHDESAGKRRSGKTRKGNRWLRTALIEAANSAAGRTRGTYLNAQYLRLKSRRGHNKAIVAVAHSILVSAYHVLDRDQSYDDLGGDYFTRRVDAEHLTRRLVRQLERLGQGVTLTPLAAETG